MLTDHFTLDELTVTANAELQEQNRAEAVGFLGALRATAKMLEDVRMACGSPIYVHSGFRCPALNGATPGASAKSQHMVGQAADISMYGPSTFEAVDRLFELTRDYFRLMKYPFGQLIREEKNGAFWVHVSLGKPWRDPARCGEVLVMVEGKYTLVEKMVG